MEILDLKELGDTEIVVSNAAWVFIKSLTNFYAFSDALPLYQILKKSNNWLWRYCI